MTAALASIALEALGLSPKLIRRANWLGRYLAVERGFDDELYKVLTQSAKDVDKALVKLTDKTNISSRIRGTQLSLVHNEMRRQMRDLFGPVSNLIRDHRKTAAKAAVEAGLYDQSRFLSMAFPNPADRAYYEESLKQTAQRNIESVMTRVLESHKPLSKNVYKTEALSKGMVDRAINAGLARGDSADDIAKSVRNLIDPKVPGGVSYAAKRLGRTEINNAYHAQSIHDAQEAPWTTEVRWNLSKVHKDDPGDACEEYADMGTFQVGHVPEKPHPNCRCYVTPELPDHEQFQQRLVAGQYDQYLDNFIAGGPAPPTPGAVKPTKPKPAGVSAIEAMEPAPPEGPTTKARQPVGWTGPPVSKAAQNPAVIATQDDLWMKYYETDTFMQAAREGSRNVQVKGYRGGLSAPGKKNIMAQQGDLIADKPMAFDLGREMTARTAYADPSAGSVYHAMNLSQGDLALLRQQRDISMPLHTYGYIEESEFRTLSPQKGKEAVVFELKPGAKVATLEGKGKSVALGQFKVDEITEIQYPNTGEKYHLVRLKQVDSREYKADTPKGKHIDQLEFVPKGEEFRPHGKAAVAKKEPKVKPRIKVDPAEVEQKIMACTTSGEVADVMSESYPHIAFDNFGQVGNQIAKGAALAVNDMEDRFPIEITSKVGFADLERLWGKEYGNAYAACDLAKTSVPEVLDAQGYPAKRWTGEVFFSNKYTQPGQLGTSYSNCLSQFGKNKFHPNWDNKTNVGDLEAARAIVTHELGHALDDRLMYDLRNTASDIVEEGWKEAVKAGQKSEEYSALSGMTKEVPITRKDYLTKNRPSKYALQKTKVTGTKSYTYADIDKINPPEFVAEAVADVVGNGYEKAAPLSQKMWDYIIRVHKVPKIWSEGKVIPDTVWLKEKGLL
jgi:hypothetical protein